MIDCIYTLYPIKCTATQLHYGDIIMINREGWSTFINFCLASKNEKKLSMLFDLLLTPEEKESLALRSLIIVELLKQEKTQRTMAEDLQVSIAKITRGSNELKRMPEELIHFLKGQIK